VARTDLRGCQKKRGRQRRLVRQIAKRLVEAESKAKEKEENSLGGSISINDLAAADKKGLIDEANLEIFLTWWSFGGAQHGLTPMQAAEMPAAMRTDFSFILETISLERRRQEKREADRKKLEGKS